MIACGWPVSLGRRGGKGFVDVLFDITGTIFAIREVTGALRWGYRYKG